MRARIRQVGYLTALLIAQAGCEDARQLSPVAPSLSPPTTSSRYDGSTGAFTIAIGGDTFYGDDATEELGPTSGVQARIDDPSSSVDGLSCNYSSSICTASYWTSPDLMDTGFTLWSGVPRSVRG